MSTPPPARPSSALDVLRRRWPIVLCCLVLAPLLAAALTVFRGAQHTATATLIVRQSPFESRLVGRDQPTVLNSAEAVPLGPSAVDAVAQRVAGELGREPDEIAALVQIVPEAAVVTSADAPATPSGMDVEAQAGDRDEAARIANAFARGYVDFVDESQRARIRAARGLVEAELDLPAGTVSAARERELRRRARGLAALERLSGGRVALVRAAEAPAGLSPVALNALLGLVLGALVGVFLAFFVDRLDQRIRRRDEVEPLVGPVLGVIDAPAGAARAAVAQGIVARLRHFGSAPPPRTVALVPVTSAARPAAAAAADLAEAAAEAELRVLLVDATAHAQPGSPPGLAEVAVEGLRLEDVARPARAGAGAVRLVGPGAAETASVALFEQPGAAGLIRDAEAAFDLTLLALPPLQTRPDAIAAAAAVDGVVLVLVLGETTLPDVERARDELRELGARALGAVLLSGRAVAGGPTLAEQPRPRDDLRSTPAGASSLQ